jgi:hypothetical protein
MKISASRLVVLLLIFSLTGLPAGGCASKYGKYDPKDKQALRTLSGGVVGGLLAWNTGGAIVGALVVDIVFLATIKYEDKQLESGEQAARKYKDREKQAEEKKEDERKAEEKRDEDRKADRSKEEEKKVEERRENEKKAEKSRIQERVKLFIEDSFVAEQTVRTGAPVEANVQYTLLVPADTEQIRITEKRILHTANKKLELDTREVLRTQGTYISTIKFTMPDDIPKGFCILYTTISEGKYERTAKSVMNII